MAITTASFRRWMEKAPENAFRRGPRRCSRNKGGGSFGRLGRDRSPRALFARTDIVSHACSDRGHNRRALARTRRRFAPRARVFNLLFPSSSREPREELLGARERGRLRILRARPRVSTRLPRVVKQTTTGASAAEPGWGGVRGASSLVVRRPRRVGVFGGRGKETASAGEETADDASAGAKPTDSTAAESDESATAAEWVPTAAPGGGVGGVRGGAGADARRNRRRCRRLRQTRRRSIRRRRHRRARRWARRRRPQVARARKCSRPRRR